MAYILSLEVGGTASLDALDYSSDSQEIGKNIGDDLAEGKPTLPLIHAFRCGDREKAAAVADVFSRGSVTDEEWEDARKHLEASLDSASGSSVACGDLDGDGYDDNLASSPLPRPDSDSDGRVDYLDIDSYNDECLTDGDDPIQLNFDFTDPEDGDSEAAA